MSHESIAALEAGARLVRTLNQLVEWRGRPDAIRVVLSPGYQLPAESHLVTNQVFVYDASVQPAGGRVISA